MKTVKDIYQFFLQRAEGDKFHSLMEFMDTISGFNIKADQGLNTMNITLGMEYYKICEKMADDSLMLRISQNLQMGLCNQYMSIPDVNTSDPQEFNRELDYGLYDFKYRGFTLVYDQFKYSVSPIVGINKKGDDDIGTAYYIGDNKFATAAHCITGLVTFNLLKPDGTPYRLKEVQLTSGKDLNEYDLAVLIVDEEPACRSFWLGEPSVLDDVLVMGYPPIPGLNTILTAEKASVANYGKFDCKAVVGQDVGNESTYFNDLEYFLINARVKGGNSGGPVINNEGKVIGTVIQIPFDTEGGFAGKRFDIMGFGICLPSKYIEELLKNNYTCKLQPEKGSFKLL